MVVSCQKYVMFLLVLLMLMVFSTASFSEVKELTDLELDQIAAGNFPEEILDLTANPQFFNDPRLKSIFDVSRLLQEVYSVKSGLMYVNSVNSDVTLQANLLFLLQTQGLQINLSNTYQSPR